MTRSFDVSAEPSSTRRASLTRDQPGRAGPMRRRRQDVEPARTGEGHRTGAHADIEHITLAHLIVCSPPAFTVPVSPMLRMPSLTPVEQRRRPAFLDLIEHQLAPYPEPRRPGSGGRNGCRPAVISCRPANRPEAWKVRTRMPCRIEGLRRCRGRWRSRVSTVSMAQVLGLEGLGVKENRRGAA
jgi:hypothetical protein